MIGKRKRDTSVVSRSTTEGEQEKEALTPTTPTEVSHDLFRKFFESQFEPLDLPKVPGEPESGEENGDDDESEESEAGSEWDGFEGEEDNKGNKVEVVEHQGSSKKSDGLMDKKARKFFMVCFVYEIHARIKQMANCFAECETTIIRS